MQDQILDDIQTTETQQTKWAGFWIRVGASLIDVLVLVPVIVLNFVNLLSIKSLAFQLLLDLTVICYKPFMEYQYGATLGKRALQIKVVNEHFGNISLPQAILRAFPYWLNQLISLIGGVLLYQHVNFESADSFIRIAALQADVMPSYISSGISFICVISMLVVAFTSRKQGIHDLMAKTFCVRV